MSSSWNNFYLRKVWFKHPLMQSRVYREETNMNTRSSWSDVNKQNIYYTPVFVSARYIFLYLAQALVPPSGGSAYRRAGTLYRSQAGACAQWY